MVPGEGAGTMGVPSGSPTAPAAKKDNKTLIIILVVAGVLLLLCCCVAILVPTIFGPGIEGIFEDVIEDLSALTYLLV
jgi:hypothetical protein